MTEKEYEQRIQDILEKAKKIEAEVNLSGLIDKDHLDCTWYGGDVGEIEMKNGYTIVLSVCGEVSISGIVNDTEVHIIDQSDSGAVYHELGDILNDEELRKLLCGYGKDNDYLYFSNNNWVEMNLVTPMGRWVDLSGQDNILDSNLLKCFEKLEVYVDYIEYLLKFTNVVVN